MTNEYKERIKHELAECLAKADEVRKAIVFGSFLTDADPHDVDVAVFVDEGQRYVPLAIKLRRLVRSVSARLPLDIIPVRPDATGAMLDEINRGETIYER